MTAAIFLSYRRKESLVEARAIYERLRADFGGDSVFIDLEGLDYGVDFVDVLEEQLANCAVMLALIGPNWLGITPGIQTRRIDDENDFVRLEIRAALARNIRVVPVLVNGAPLPDSAGLPPDLQPLLRRHALELDFRRFDADINRLVGALRRVPGISSKDQTYRAQDHEDKSMIASRLAKEVRAINKPATDQYAPTAATTLSKTNQAPEQKNNEASPIAGIADEGSTSRSEVLKPAWAPLVDFLNEIAGHQDPTISQLRKGLVIGAVVAGFILILAILISSMSAVTSP